MEYFQDEKPTRRGVCSDPECPCNETSIPVGQGYLYIPKSCCDFRWDCRTQKELVAKAERMARQSGNFLMFGHGLAGPILVCELGAKKRNLDLAIAAEDAKHWWKTGQVPFRPTPRAGEASVPFTKDEPMSASSAFLTLLVLAAIGVIIWLLFR